MHWGVLVKQIRSALQYSQEQFARELNVSFSTVNRWEKGKSNPSPMAKEMLRQLCMTKGIDYDFLRKEMTE